MNVNITIVKVTENGYHTNAFEQNQRASELKRKLYKELASLDCKAEPCIINIDAFTYKALPVQSCCPEHNQLIEEAIRSCL